MDSPSTSNSFEPALEKYEREKNNKGARINLRIHQWEKTKWEKEAEVLDIKVSQLILNAMYQYLKDIKKTNE
jgi:hypothetical protein